MVLIEVESESGNSIVIKVVDDVEKVLPFRSRVIRWKEEIYFPTPYEYALRDAQSSIHVTPGKVYYWVPEKAFCLFYGISEPYTSVYLVGDYIGPLHTLSKFDEGNVSVSKHSPEGELLEISESLSNLGYDTATPLSDGVRYVAASKWVGNVRIAFSVYREEYGVHIESDSFYKYSHDYLTIKFTAMLKSKVKSLSDIIRLDINESGYTCLTTTVQKVSELGAAVKDLERVYQYVMKELQ